MTRNIVLMTSVSLDGYFEGPNREIDWHLVDDEVHSHVNAYLAGVDGFLNGRVTHELMAGFWPTADQDPANAGPVAEFAAIWRNKPKTVYSRTLPPGPAAWNTTIVPEVVPEEVRALKEQPGGDLELGGTDLAASFFRHGLVDELRILVHPVVLGRGRRLFPEADVRTPLDLLETRTFGNGVVLLHYKTLTTAAD